PIRQLRPVSYIPRDDPVRHRYHVVHAPENVIFITHLRSDNAVPAETASDGIVRNRIIREQLLNQRREWNGIKARQDSIVGIGIRHKSDTRQPQPPAKTSRSGTRYRPCSLVNTVRVTPVFTFLT